MKKGWSCELNNDKIVLKGTTGARVFKKGAETKEYKPGDTLSFLLK